MADIHKRDSAVLQRIIKYCDDIEKTNALFGNSETELRNNSVYMNALSMCILQIGELTTHLSDDFKNAHTNVPWRDIKDMRNIAAHHYGEFSAIDLWATIINDIPVLRRFCEDRLNEQQE